MTTALALPQSQPRSVARLYRRYVSLPTRVRWGIGFAGALVCAAFGAAGLLAWVLVVSVATDLLWRRIFNALVGPALLVVLAMHLTGYSRGLPNAEASAIGFAACFGMMLGLHLMFRGGEGDVKLAALLGAVLGAFHGVEALVAGYVLAAGVTLAIVAARLLKRALGRLTAPRLLTGTLPMAPFYAAGVAFTLTF